jgi:hypothetical protein
MIFASPIFTKLIVFTEHLATPTLRFEYRVGVGIPLSSVRFRDNSSRQNQAKLRSVYAAFLTHSSLQEK